MAVMFVSELNAVRQKNVGLERDFLKAQKVLIIPALLPPPPTPSLSPADTIFLLSSPGAE